MMLTEKPIFMEGLPVTETSTPTIVIASNECVRFRMLLDRVHLEMMACEHWETAAQITIMSAEFGVMEAVLNDLIKNYRSKVKLENQ